MLLTGDEIKLHKTQMYCIQHHQIITHSLTRRFEQIVTPCWDSSAISRPAFDDVVTVMESLFLQGRGGDEYYYERAEVAPELGNNMYEAVPSQGYDNETYEATAEDSTAEMAHYAVPGHAYDNNTEATPQPDEDIYEPTQ